MLRQSQSQQLRVTFAGDVLTDWEIQQTLLTDMRFVLVSVAIAIAALTFATRSFALTVCGVLQITLSFPVSYTLYYFASGRSEVTMIQFLAPFVILGAMLDPVLSPNTYSVAWSQSMQSALAHCWQTLLRTTVNDSVITFLE